MHFRYYCLTLDSLSSRSLQIPADRIAGKKKDWYFVRRRYWELPHELLPIREKLKRFKKLYVAYLLIPARAALQVSAFFQLRRQFMPLLQLLNLFFAFGGQFLELIDSIPHFRQCFLLIGADGIQRFHDIGKGSLHRLNGDIGFH